MHLIIRFIRAASATLPVFGLPVLGLPVLGLLVLGLAVPAAGAAELPRGAGVWTVLAKNGPDGRAAGGGECGLASHLPNGADLRLIIANGEVRLVAHNPGWMLPAGQADVTVTMGQDAFIGSASVADRSTLVVEDLSRDFLRHFLTAPAMTTDFGGIRWKVDLRASERAAWALARCASAAGLADAT